MYQANNGKLSIVEEETTTTIGIKRCRSSPDVADLDEVAQSPLEVIQGDSDNSNHSISSITSQKVQDIDSLATAKEKLTLLMRDRRRLRKSLNSYYEQDESLMCRSQISSLSEVSENNNTRDVPFFFDKENENSNSNASVISLTKVLKHDRVQVLVSIDKMIQDQGIDIAKIIQSIIGRSSQSSPAETTIIEPGEKKKEHGQEASQNTLLCMAGEHMSVVLDRLKSKDFFVKGKAMAVGISSGTVTVTNNMKANLTWVVAKDTQNGQTGFGCHCRTLDSTTILNSDAKSKNDATNCSYVITEKDVYEAMNQAWEKLNRV